MAEPVIDEMSALRALRADAPLPDHARLTPARQRLLDEIAGTEQRRARWKLKALGAVAAVVAAALLSTLVLRGEPATPAEPAAPPRADQWVYLESRYDLWQCRTSISNMGYTEAGQIILRGPEPCSTEPAKPRLQSSWTRYDGAEQAYGKPDASRAEAEEVRPWNGRNTNYLTPQETDALVADLPDDPDAALRLIRARSIPDRATYKVRLTQAQRDFEEVVDVLANATAVPSDKARTMHRVITGLAGVTRPVTTTDGTGRKVLAIGVEGEFRDYAWERNYVQVLLDPETFAYRGVRWVAALDYYVDGKPSTGPFVAKGTVIGKATRLSTVVVDKAGERH
ncbi:hypothetical protein [Streptomyces sp. NPDC048737]|uniref:hypothetical protein n=1 Tax=unclassified Streptomyces TaxID=2593676 RepID=UPI003445E305